MPLGQQAAIEPCVVFIKGRVLLKQYNSWSQTALIAVQTEESLSILFHWNAGLKKKIDFFKLQEKSEKNEQYPVYQDFIRFLHYTVSHAVKTMFLLTRYVVPEGKQEKKKKHYYRLHLIFHSSSHAKTNEPKSNRGTISTLLFALGVKKCSDHFPG